MKFESISDGRFVIGLVNGREIVACLIDGHKNPKEEVEMRCEADVDIIDVISVKECFAEYEADAPEAILLLTQFFSFLGSTRYDEKFWVGMALEELIEAAFSCGARAAPRLPDTAYLKQQ